MSNSNYTFDRHVRHEMNGVDPNMNRQQFFSDHVVNGDSVPPQSPYLNEFMLSFKSLNPNANLIPTQDNTFNDDTAFHDFKFGKFRKLPKVDSQLHDDVYGKVFPNRNYGRSDKQFDEAYLRESNTERAMATMRRNQAPVYKKERSTGNTANTTDQNEERLQLDAEIWYHVRQNGGSRNDEVPLGTNLKPHQYNPKSENGTGIVYNKNLPRFDAEVMDRLYKPAPSRVLKMNTIDIEEHGMVPQSQVLVAEDYVKNDMQRFKIGKIRKNVDIFETPRTDVWGVKTVQEGPRAHPSTHSSRQRIRPDVIPGYWSQPNYEGSLHAESNQDQLDRHLANFRYVRGYDLEKEIQQFAQSERAYREQAAQKLGVRIDVSGGAPGDIAYPYNSKFTK